MTLSGENRWQGLFERRLVHMYLSTIRAPYLMTKLDSTSRVLNAWEEGQRLIDTQKRWKRENKRLVMTIYTSFVFGDDLVIKSPSDEVPKKLIICQMSPIQSFAAKCSKKHYMHHPAIVSDLFEGYKYLLKPCFCSVFLPPFASPTTRRKSSSKNES